jgi:hypothetical protein
MNNENNILNEDGELKKTAPVLSGLKKENPFTVPEDYFKALPQIIMEKCQPNDAHKKWSWGIFTIYKRMMVVATVIVVLVIATFFLFVKPWRPVQKNEANYNTFIQDEGIINDLSDIIDESSVIEAVISESSENSPDSAILVQDDILKENRDYTKDDLINYLLDSNTELDNMTQ